MKLPSRFHEDHPHVVLLLVLAVALGVRLITLVSFDRSIYGSSLMPDEQVFDHWARKALEGVSPPEMVGFDIRVPVYVFSTLYSLFGADPSVVREFNVLLGTLTCLCLYFAGKELSDRTTGLLAALGGALYGPFLLASVTAHKTALALFLIAVATALGARVAMRPRRLEFACLGIALGVATHVRGNALILVLAAPLAFWWVWRKRDVAMAPQLASYALGLAIALVPLAKGGFLGASEHGFNLYLANNLDNPTPYYRPARFAPSQPSFQGGGFMLAASLDVGRRLSADEAREYYATKLRSTWLADPAAAMKKASAKLAASINVYEHAHNHNLAFISRFVPSLGWPWMGFALLFGSATVGAVFGWRIQASRWLLVAVAGYWISLVVFFTDVRLRAPFALLLLPLGALGVQEVLRRRGRDLVAPALVFAGAVAAAHLPVPGAGDLTTAYNFHGLMLLDSGDLHGAERYYRISHRLDGLDSESALIGLASVAVQRGDLEQAQALLLQMEDDHYKAGDKYEHLGGVLVRQHRFGEAAIAYERALEINPGLLRIYPILSAVYSRLGESFRASETNRRYRYAQSFFE